MMILILFHIMTILFHIMMILSLPAVPLWASYHVSSFPPLIEAPCLLIQPQWGIILIIFMLIITTTFIIVITMMMVQVALVSTSTLALRSFSLLVSSATVGSASRWSSWWFYDDLHYNFHDGYCEFFYDFPQDFMLNMWIYFFWRLTTLMTHVLCE